MKRKQFSEEQIISILKEAEADAVLTELCRKYGMSSATYYACKVNFGDTGIYDMPTKDYVLMGGHGFV